MELWYCRVRKVGVTSETIEPDWGPTGMGMAVPGSAVGGRCVLLLWLLFLPHPKASHRSIYPPAFYPKATEFELLDVRHDWVYIL